MCVIEGHIKFILSSQSFFSFHMDLDPQSFQLFTVHSTSFWLPGISMLHNILPLKAFFFWQFELETVATPQLELKQYQQQNLKLHLRWKLKLAKPCHHCKRSRNNGGTRSQTAVERGAKPQLNWSHTDYSRLDTQLCTKMATTGQYAIRPHLLQRVCMWAQLNGNSKYGHS